MKLLYADDCSSGLAKAFTKLVESSGKISTWLCVFNLHQNHRYPYLSPSSLELSLRTIWGAVSQAAVLILPRIKLNPQLSHCAVFCFFVCFFFVSRQHRPRGGTESPAPCLWRRASYFLGLQPPVHLQWPGRKLLFSILTGISGLSLTIDCIASSPQGWGYGAASTSSLLDSSPSPQAFLSSHPCPTHHLQTRQKN